MRLVMPTCSEHLLGARTALIAGLFALGLAACAPKKPVPAEPTPPAPAAGTAAAPAGNNSMAGMPGMEGMDHGHMMTPEQMAELRSKVPLYAASTDEQIMANMGRMPPNFWALISPKDMQGPVGVVALGHGYKLGGNEQFENYAGPIAQTHPTAVAAGMAMDSSAHIQSALDELTSKHGVKTIVVVPMEPGDDTSLVRQWRYIFGLRDDSSYLTPPRVKTDAKIIFTKSPAADPRIGTIMRDYAMEVAGPHPEQDRVVLVSHGPERPENNPAELALLEKHADEIRQSSKFTDIKVLSIEDDAVPEIRATRVAELRAYIKEATDQGREVVIVPLILTKGGFHARLQKDLEGLDYKFANRGLIEHPLFQEWISATVRDAAGS